MDMMLTFVLYCVPIDNRTSIGAQEDARALPLMEFQSRDLCIDAEEIFGRYLTFEVEQACRGGISATGDKKVVGTDTGDLYLTRWV